MKERIKGTISASGKVRQNTDIDALNAEIKHNDSYSQTNLEAPHQDHRNLDERVINKGIKGRKATQLFES